MLKETHTFSWIKVPSIICICLGSEITGYQCTLSWNIKKIVAMLRFCCFFLEGKMKHSCGIENSIFILCEENSIRKRFEHGK